MLLHRVSLQGFLAHYGQEIDGAILPIDLDFRGSGLWLMHGANGSGKSSVFDAITFALFDKARGSQLAKLVNDNSKAAHVEVEFEHKGERYLVKRTLKLTKNREKHSSSTALVSRWDNAQSGWVAVEGVGKIRDWTTRTLQVSYENFISSVILEQGRADQFLRATPRDRREQLMQLLDLSIYEKISDAANARRNLSRVELKSKEAQLERSVPVAPEDLARTEVAVREAQTRHSHSGEAVNGAQKARDDAARAAELDAQIVAKTKQQNADADITADAETIENAVRERDELNAILPSLRALSGARRASSHAARELDLARAELAAAQQKERELTPIVEQTHGASEAANIALTEARLSATQAELDGKSAQSDAETLNQIEELEAQIAGCARDLEPHQSWLERADSIEARRAQSAQLNEITRVVKPINEAAQKLGRAQSADKEAQAAHEKALELAKNAEAELENASAARRELEGAGDELKTQRANLNAKLEFNRETLNARDELEHADECPTCGSELDSDEARARIEDEREILRRDVEKWESRLGEIESQLRAIEADNKTRAGAEKMAREGFDKTSRAFDKTEAQTAATSRELDEKTREYQRAREAAGAWADEDLAQLQARLTALAPQTLEADWSALQNARGAQLQIEATARANRAQLQRLPDWNDEKRRAIGELQRDLAGVLARARAALSAAQSLASEAGERHETAQDNLTRASNAAQIADALQSQKVTAADNAQVELDSQLENLAPAWKGHRAAREDDALAELAARYDELQPLAARADELRAARQRVSNLESEIGLLRAQIAAIPLEHRGDVAAFEAALSAARAALAEADEALSAARENLLLTRNGRATWVRCEAELAAAQIEFGRDRDLAEALGRDGLQARIIKRAQENLRSAANGILGRLSKGQWQIDLRAQGEDDSELEIIARDDARGGYERTFDALSGGERFRVAISLAIAIGQMAAGGAPMNTLVIDEGFGALDEENRGLMVDNLRHLSDHELKGGRIIVVSHQDDVRDAFGARYELSRDKSGYAKVEMTLG